MGYLMATLMENHLATHLDFLTVTLTVCPHWESLTDYLTDFHSDFHWGCLKGFPMDLHLESLQTDYPMVRLMESLMVHLSLMVNLTDSQTDFHLANQMVRLKAFLLMESQMGYQKDYQTANHSVSHLGSLMVTLTVYLHWDFQMATLMDSRWDCLKAMQKESPLMDCLMVNQKGYRMVMLTVYPHLGFLTVIHLGLRMEILTDYQMVSLMVNCCRRLLSRLPKSAQI